MLCFINNHYLNIRKKKKEKVISMLEGKKTYIGLIISLVGALGLFKYVSEGDLTTTLNTLFEIGGLALATYGRFKAQPKK